MHLLKNKHTNPFKNKQTTWLLHNEIRVFCIGFSYVFFFCAGFRQPCIANNTLILVLPWFIICRKTLKQFVPSILIWNDFSEQWPLFDIVQYVRDTSNENKVCVNEGYNWVSYPSRQWHLFHGSMIDTYGLCNNYGCQPTLRSIHYAHHVLYLLFPLYSFARTYLKIAMQH